MTLTEIWIYPIKSLGGIRVDKGIVRKKGLQYDRRWMLVDGQGVAMTQRVYPRMALFRPGINGDTIRVNYMKSGSIVSSVEFSAKPRSGEFLTARVWDDDVAVREVDSAVSRWFSEHLGIDCRLVSFPEENPRPVNPKYAVGDDHVSLADAYPFMVIGESSLADLNQKLATPVPMNRFRPNFVFRGGPPFAEDDWKRLTIGNVSFAAVKKCDRCVMTTVDQETTEKGPEPLQTLASYRKVDNKVYFGQNMIALNEGTVTVGDAIIQN